EAREETIRRMMQSNKSGLTEAIWALIPDGVANAVISRIDGKIVNANWVYEMLATRDPAQAEMIYWRNVLYAQWNAMGLNNLDTEEMDVEEHARTFHSMPRRMQQLIYR